jgi:hypothetical protein
LIHIKDFGGVKNYPPAVIDDPEESTRGHWINTCFLFWSLMVRDADNPPC